MFYFWRYVPKSWDERHRQIPKPVYANNGKMRYCRYVHGKWEYTFARSRQEADCNFRFRSKCASKDC